MLKRLVFAVLLGVHAAAGSAPGVVIYEGYSVEQVSYVLTPEVQRQFCLLLTKPRASQVKVCASMDARQFDWWFEKTYRAGLFAHWSKAPVRVYAQPSPYPGGAADIEEVDLCAIGSYCFPARR
ncbi:hypothetical protein [Bordetella pseudohinzii]|uniref:Islet-activating protein S5 n=1 Tax=Bordetella pseudohinzii TaxID=1331258 RepID=A0A0J6F363_9BORD|nr:hypothetical protein [Bordetella pseudohinzii]ANY14720.1 hypothetical protein BBN53_01730 [Bordetella pseudohinzii]KMM26920.1 pertussis toxin subunit 5 [Bordetella pseudohinzii]KXA76229.1 hypothetical protein AW877_17405 [Bordetella pseudohinzii]KXA78117.1 hypothetical protein AW878_13600 [Bordetella pseudohinzii]CUI59712.1 Islet-activating protein S5 [Bordetella pseudohinzii]